MLPDPTALVQSLASYSGLSSLVLQDLHQPAPAAGGMGPALEALAAGPLSKSLSYLWVFFGVVLVFSRFRCVLAPSQELWRCLPPRCSGSSS
jgi:hypothetical protein